MQDNRFKFRVWDAGLLKWCQPDVISPLKFIETEKYVSIVSKDSDYIIQQCTGHVDQAGNNIYEGDLICIQNNPCKDSENYVVEYSKCWSQFHLVCGNKSMQMSGIRFSGTIVGNIFDKDLI